MISVGSAESILSVAQSNSVDLVFTMAVLMHLPPESSSVLRDMARVARRWIVTIELEHVVQKYIFPRRYDRVFTSLGFREQWHEDVPSIVNYEGYVARVFVRP